MKLETTDTVQVETNITCYVALGSNMGDSQAYIDQAVEDLKSHSQIHDLRSSQLYKSKPHGPQNQPDYLNGAVEIKTELKPEELLDLLQKIENDNDRVREGVVRWGARTLDLDLLFYSDQSIDTKRLTVPHPRICERAFVLFPLRDLLGEKGITNLKINETHSILDCINSLSEDDVKSIKELDHVK